ncbi:hypothetical protein [Chamaesiphon sp. VAR_69_metabat_338]|uniref:hypothetical protein n=1 Tax=Chamaesiphon sp. VAR_69_metabat_338 TaxID=2964704 RepID=UPI00286DE86E|nr:hypothetical protein [Chamaesiphon sp. VAR_69_metabat_338]
MTERIKIERIEIYGIQIPSNETLNAILSELETPEKRGDFIDNSNQIIEHMRKFFNPNILDNSRSARTGLLPMENCRSQCKLLGVDFHAVWHCKAVIDWFRILKFAINQT